MTHSRHTGTAETAPSAWSQHPAAAAPAGTPAPRASSLPLFLWAIGILALAGAITYIAALPSMQRRDAFALLDNIQIKLEKSVRYDQDNKPVPQISTNPVTKKSTGLYNYNAFVGMSNSPDRPDFESRRNFIALADLCGRNPKLAMEVFRAGLESPLDAKNFQRRMVANEMLIYLRDVYQRDPADPSLKLTMQDLYKVARIADAEEFQAGAARHGADILRLFLAFPSEFPSELPVMDKDATGKYGIGRIVYLVPVEYAGVKFREPFAEQGRDMLLLLEGCPASDFAWNETIHRFMYKLPPPPAPGATPAPVPAPASGSDPLKGLAIPGPEAPLPLPPAPAVPQP